MEKKVMDRCSVSEVDYIGDNEIYFEEKIKIFHFINIWAFITVLRQTTTAI